MNHFSKRLVTELVISLVVIAALFVGVLFFMGKTDDYAKTIVSQRTVLADRAESLVHLAELRNQYASAKNYLNILYNIIPSYDQLVNLNQDIQSLAAREKVEYGFAFAGETPRSDSGLGSVAFNLSIASTNYDALVNFIKDLQDFRYLDSIDNVSLRSNDNKLTMAVKGRVFYR